MKFKKTPKQKALYFDLRTKDLKKYYSGENPQNGYRLIQKFLISNNFTHEQYSGYHSNYKTTDLDIFKLVSRMYDELPWLQPCVNHFEVTNIGANHDLVDLFAQDPASFMQ